MTKKELANLIVELQVRHHEDFVRWYDQARLSTVEEYAEMGFLLDRYYFAVIEVSPSGSES